MIGASYRDGTTDQREAALRSLPSLEHRVLLRTCHRVELIGLSDGEIVVPSPLRVSRGRAAVVRALRTVAGLDSAILAEEQLLGQVRDAYDTALADGHTEPILNELLRRALRLGRRARSMVGPSVDRSLADRALRCVPSPSAALVVGSGAMAARLADGLVAIGCVPVVASGSLERATALAGRVGGRAVAWTPQLVDEGWDLVAVATRVTEPLLTAAPAGGGHVIDLCAPPAVSAGARRDLGDRLVDLDALGAAAGMAGHDARAVRRLERLVEEEAEGFLRWIDARGAADDVAALHARAAELLDSHVGSLRRNDRFDAAQLAAVERMASQLVGELLHEPTLRLRAGRDA